MSVRVSSFTASRPRGYKSLSNHDHMTRTACTFMRVCALHERPVSWLSAKRGFWSYTNSKSKYLAYPEAINPKDTQFVSLTCDDNSAFPWENQ
jgi:hypothetical protein